MRKWHGLTLKVYQKEYFSNVHVNSSPFFACENYNVKKDANTFCKSILKQYKSNNKLDVPYTGIFEDSAKKNNANGTPSAISYNVP